MTDIGLMIEGQWGLTWPRWNALLEAAERYGFQCVFRSDHFTIGPPDDDSLETFISLTYAADHTRTVDLGTLVAPTTFRHPALTARMAAQIDDLSGGRFTIGLGTGWHEREHQQFGIPFYDVNTRFEMLEDALEITTRLFNSDTPVSYTGKHYSLDEAVLLPRPARKGGPPILIGGNGMNRTLPLTARYAHEWNGVWISVAGFRERIARLDQLLDENGRGRKAVKRSLMTQVVIGTDEAAVRAKLDGRDPADEIRERSMIIGTPSQIVDQIGAYVDAGCQRFMLMWKDQTDFDGLDLLATQVLHKLK